MSSSEIEKKLAKIFINLAIGERKAEISRQVLCENEDFNSFQLFKLLDKQNKNFIDCTDIMNFLTSKGISADNLEVQLLILFYDQNYDRVLSFDEFQFLIKSQNSSKEYPNSNITNNEPINFNIGYSFSKLLGKEIQLARKIIQLLNEIKNNKNFNIHELYHKVKVSNFIDEEGIKNFMNNNCESFLDSDIISILKRLDLNKNGIVDLCEFHAFLGFPDCYICCPCSACKRCGTCYCRVCFCECHCKYHNRTHKSYNSPSKNFKGLNKNENYNVDYEMNSNSSIRNHNINNDLNLNNSANNYNNNYYSENNYNDSNYRNNNRDNSYRDNNYKDYNNDDKNFRNNNNYDKKYIDYNNSDNNYSNNNYRDNNDNYSDNNYRENNYKDNNDNENNFRNNNYNNNFRDNNKNDNSYRDNNNYNINNNYSENNYKSDNDNDNNFENNQNFSNNYHNYNDNITRNNFNNKNYSDNNYKENNYNKKNDGDYINNNYSDNDYRNNNNYQINNYKNDGFSMKTKQILDNNYQPNNEINKQPDLNKEIKEENPINSSFNYKNNLDLQKISKSLTIRPSPERKYSPKKYYLSNTRPNHNINNEDFNQLNQNNIKTYNFQKESNYPENKIIDFNNINPDNQNEYKENRGNNNNKDNKFKKKFNLEKKDEYEENQFIEFMRQMMLAEGQIEKIKINLALCPDFNCEDCFRIFEVDKKGSLYPEDIKIGLKLLGVFYSDFEVELFFRRFDLQNRGYINYSDFFDIFVPFQKDFRNMVEERKPNSCCPCRCPDVFCPDTISLMKNLLDAIIRYENNLNFLRRGFTTLNLKLKKIFENIDIMKMGYFTNNELSLFLKKNKIFTNNLDADLLFIRLDKNRNGKIDYKEIYDETHPLYNLN